MRTFTPRALSRARIVAVIIWLIALLVPSSGHQNDVVEPDFDEDMAREIVKLTQIAYCTEELVDWTCTNCQNFPGVRNVSLLDGKARNVRGFIGVDLGVERGLATLEELDATSMLNLNLRASNDDSASAKGVASSYSAPKRYYREVGSGEASSRPRIVVAFAGTDLMSIKNIFDDIQADLVLHEYGGHCEKCRVHGGFVASYKLVEKQIRATVALHLRRNPTAEVVITGHSFGGALATLCLLDLRLTLGGNISFAPLYTYGIPRVGNAPFATYSASIGVPIFRVVHHRDPVPHLPFLFWGYVHPPREVFYDAPMTSYVVCDDSGEDPTCSDQFLSAPNFAYINDHFSYLGVDYATSYLQCLL